MIQMWLLTVNIGTLFTILIFGIKMLRFINRMEFQLEILWADYKHRVEQNEKSIRNMESI